MNKHTLFFAAMLVLSSCGPVLNRAEHYNKICTTGGGVTIWTSKDGTGLNVDVQYTCEGLDAYLTSITVPEGVQLAGWNVLVEPFDATYSLGGAGVNHGESPGSVRTSIDHFSFCDERNTFIRSDIMQKDQTTLWAQSGLSEELVKISKGCP